jgi:YD repeat-containing protein
MTTTKSHDLLNRLTGISSVPSASAAVSFNYAYNSANQRTAVTNADNSRWAYGYDTLGQVTNAVKRWNDGPDVKGSVPAFVECRLGLRPFRSGDRSHGAHTSSAKR